MRQYAPTRDSRIFSGRTFEQFVHEVFPHLMIVSGVWMEPTCNVCHANCPGPSMKSNYMQGLLGFAEHIQAYHNEDENNEDEDNEDNVVRHFLDFRPLSDHDVELLSHGEQPPADLEVPIAKILPIQREDSRPLSDQDAGLLSHGEQPTADLEVPIAKMPRMRARKRKSMAISNGTDTPIFKDIPDYLSEVYPHVLHIDGKWQEISCKHCGANSNTRMQYFLGFVGLGRHVSLRHGFAGCVSAILEHANLRELNDQEITLLRS